MALDDALQVLARIDQRQSRIVELRFFAGLPLEEISKALEVGSAGDVKILNFGLAKVLTDQPLTRVLLRHPRQPPLDQISRAPVCT